MLRTNGRPCKTKTDLNLTQNLVQRYTEVTMALGGDDGNGTKFCCTSSGRGFHHSYPFSRRSARSQFLHTSVSTKSHDSHCDLCKSHTYPCASHGKLNKCSACTGFASEHNRCRTLFFAVGQKVSAILSSASIQSPKPFFPVSLVNCKL